MLLGGEPARALPNVVAGDPEWRVRTDVDASDRLPLAGDGQADQTLGLCRSRRRGGEDVDPARYGEQRSEKVRSVNAARDATEAALIEEARARGTPVLAICRGIQILNVALGGTLVQDIPSQCETTIDHDDEGARNS